MKDFYSTLAAEVKQGEGDGGWLTRIQEASLEQIQRSLENSLEWVEW